MSMIFYDPVDQGSTALLFNGLWTATARISPTSLLLNPGSTVVAVNTSPVRFAGRKSIFLQGGDGNGSPGIYRTIGNESNIYSSGSFFLNGYAAAAGGNNCVWACADAGTLQILFVLDLAGRINIYRGGTFLAVSSNALTASTWRRAEFHVVIDGTTGFAECKMDGVSWVTFSGNTKNSANAYANQIFFSNGTPGGGGTGTANWMDLLIYNGSGAAPNGYLGDKRFYLTSASGNGSANQYSQTLATFPPSTALVLNTIITDGTNLQVVTTAGTTGGSAPTWNTTVGGTTTSGSCVFTNLGPPSNYKLINQSPPVTGFSYLTDATAGHEQRFTYSALPSTVTGIIGVGVMDYSAKDDAGTRTIRHEVESGGVTVDNGADYAELSSAQYHESFFPNDPNTSAAWTKTAVDASEAGVKTTA